MPQNRAILRVLALISVNLRDILASFKYFLEEIFKFNNLEIKFLNIHRNILKYS